MESDASTADAEGVTAGLVELARGIRADDLPDEVARRVGVYTLDWLGVTIRGASTPAARATRAALAQPVPDGALVLGEQPIQVSPHDAALFNGVASHALDYDDGSGTGGLPHSSVTIMSTLLALNSSGADLVAAVVAGQETGVRVAGVVEPEHYARGFHNLATTGMFSAAGAGSHLLGLEHDQWRVALGIAGSIAGGLRASFGTMTKPLHAGRAASGAVIACLLAQRGFTANPDIVEARNGYARTMTDVPRFDRGRRPLERPFVIEGVRFKLHASCTGTQSTIDALRAVRRQQGLAPDQVDRIRVAVDPIMLDVCSVVVPETGLEAKFSIPYAAALALHDLDTTENGFTDEGAHDPVLRELMTPVDVVALRDPASNDDTEITIVTRDGRRLTRRHRFADNRLDLDAETAAVTEKFVRLVSGLLPPARIDAVVSTALAVHRLASVRELLALLD